MTKNEVCNILNDISLLLQLKGENFFKTKAYTEGARILEQLNEDIEVLVREDRLKEIKGIGKALDQKISELVLTDKLEYYENLKKEVPSGLIEMLKIPGLGAKKIRILYEKLNITTIAELELAAKNNKLIAINGFGEKTQTKLLENIENLNKYKSQMKLFEAEIIANELLAAIKNSKKAIRAEICGSLRRKKEIVKDIDILVSTDDLSISRVFLEHPLVENIINQGNTKLSVGLKGGINADLRIVNDEQFPYALHHFTGSKEHNTKMRHLSKEQGIKINEYGVFKGEELIKCKNEEDIFSIFGMQYVTPELREDMGEVEHAIGGNLPLLINVSDIKGLVHIHSNYSDGENSIEELTKTLIKKGYEYFVLSDHSKTAFYANGLLPDRIKKQHEEVDYLNNKYKNFKIIKSIELDILLDGNVDYEEEILKSFDIRIASVHSSFNMDQDKVTARVVNALKNKYVNILGHPTGRLLLQREPLKLDMDQVMLACLENNVVLEINSYYERLDLDWRYVRKAKDMGCKFVISSDAHSLSGLDNLPYGINVARKGWLEKNDVINTLNKDDFLNFVHKL